MLKHGYLMLDENNITMSDVLHALEMELPTQEAFEIYEWYCKTYNKDGCDEAPSSIVHEVFGL